jgi:hypothetical protein
LIIFRLFADDGVIRVEHLLAAYLGLSERTL